MSLFPEIKPPTYASQKKKGHADKISFIKSYDLISKLPVLRKLDIEKFRNSYEHNLCLDMLTTGFHMSYIELINLIRQQMTSREAAGPESFLWTKPILMDQMEKLNLLRLHLTKAETATRMGQIKEEYNARYALAQAFSVDPDDQWLADHFFTTCLDVARREEKSETRMLAEGLCNVGLCLHKNGHYKEAAKHFESYHNLSLRHTPDWFTNSGTSFYIDSCVQLFHAYTVIGLEFRKSAEGEEHESSLQTLIKALDMAKNSGDPKLEGMASYNLGLAYQRDNQLEEALKHLFNYYESCKDDSDSEGTGQACDAIAKIYARQGNKEKSVEFLKRFVELTEKTGLEKEYCTACYNLGNVCNSVGNYNEATEYFSKAYNISRVLGDPVTTNINRVNYGIAVAHRMMGRFANHIVISDRLCVDRLVAWKSVRRDEFNKSIPDTDPHAAFHLLMPPPPGEEHDDQEDDRTVRSELEDFADADSEN